MTSKRPKLLRALLDIDLDFCSTIQAVSLTRSADADLDHGSCHSERYLPGLPKPHDVAVHYHSQVEQAHVELVPLNLTTGMLVRGLVEVTKVA
jgi:hypothetical protein